MAHKQIQFGSIVHHPDLPHPDGTLAGPHFCVVVSDEAEISAGSVLQVAGISTTGLTAGPLPSGWFLIDIVPGRPGGDPMTGLVELCAVKCNWIVEVARSDINFRNKHVPLKVAKGMIAWLEARKIEAAAHEAEKVNPPGTA